MQKPHPGHDPHDPKDRLPVQAPQWIDDAEALTRLLVHAAGKRLMLAVGGSGGPYNSMLLSADPRTRQLVIDPPFPALPQPLELGTLLTLSTRIDGAVMDFTCVFEDVAELGGEEAMVLRWPQRLRYLQRRAAQRLGVPDDLHVPPAVLRDRDGTIDATLVDLSRLGAAALVPRTHVVQPGTTMECTIAVGEIEFTTTAEVKSCIASLDRLRIGLQFGEIPPAVASRLSAAVAKLERATLRRAAEQRTRAF